MGAIIKFGPRIYLPLGMLLTVLAMVFWLAFIFTWTSTYTSAKANLLNSWGKPVDALEEIERYNSRFVTPPIHQLELSITPRALSPADTLKLADLLEKYKSSTEIIHSLRFAYHLSRGDKQAAQFVLEKLNHHLAKNIVEAVRTKRALDHQLQTINAEEDSEIQQEVNRLSSLPECQRRLEMGEMTPDSYETCVVAEFALDYLPIPIFKFGKAASTIARGIARREATIISREALALHRNQLMRVPTIAGLSAKYEWRKAAIQQQLQQKIESENFMTKVFVDLERKIIIEFLKSTVVTLN